MTLRGQRILIIGGTSGIGFAVAEAAGRDGGEIVVASSAPAKVDAAIQRLGGGAAGAPIEVKDARNVEAFFARAGRFDHLVFTAGDWDTGGRGPLAETDLERAREVFSVRFWGALTVAKHAQKTLAASGSITLTDGMIAHRPRKGSALSTAMAGAIEHLTRGLAVDLAPIRVNAVCPGLVRTDIWARIPESQREEQFLRMTKAQPLARVGEPAEVAEAYLYLMRASYTTGQVLHVDGGGSIV
jgi:NAD(P)-dependent dehydrogenase (short-subunit alcohol dehydrogenase family)